MPSRAEAATAAGHAAIFAAMGDPTRLALLRTLAGGESRSIAALGAGSGMSRQALTKHLRVLEEVGLVRGERIGRERRFAFEPEPLDRARAYLDRVSASWDDALGRLKALVENEEAGH